MPEIEEFEADSRNIEYRVRVEVVAEILDKETGHVIVAGTESEVKSLYRTLKRRSE